MNSNDYIAIEDRYGAHNYHPLDVVIEKGNGVWVWDVDGKKYMDCLAAYSAVNQGHCHPRLIKVMQGQAEKLTLTSRAFRNNLWPLFAQKVCEILGFEKVLPMNSGAEAVETAIKIARKWGYKIKKVEKDKAEIIVCKGNFHGRTTTIVSFSDDPSAAENYGPYTPGFKQIPFGDANALEDAVTSNTVAFLVEPIQGEAGVVVPPDGFLRQAAEICQKNNVLLIADEIQSGLGRTGKMLACEHENVKPDMITIGKALSGGFYPVSAVLADARVMDVIEPGTHGSTYGGNPLAAAIAIEALSILQEEKLCDNAAKLGAYLLERLQALKSPYIDFVRGKGLWIGIVLKPGEKNARSFCQQLKAEGILAKDTHEHIIRLAPPLVITREEIDWVIDRVAKVLS